MKYLSMFSGIGGFDLALNRKGHDCIGYSEIDKYSIQTYKKNFGDEVKNYGNATTINADGLPDFDLLCGGFPCQAFSIAGNRRGFEDTRGTLFFEIARIIKIKRPKFLLLENVKGLLSHESGKTFSTIIQTLEELGYNIKWVVLNSKFFGVPQNRERVFIIGHLRGTRSRQVFPIGQICTNTDETNQGRVEIQTAQCLTRRMHKMGRDDNYLVIPVLTPNRTNKRQNGRRFKEPGEESFTLTGQDQHGICIISHSPRCGDPLKGGTGLLSSEEHCFCLDTSPHYVSTSRIRRLTPLECERLQGFPDNWTEGVSDSQRYKQLGNAVTVNVIEYILENLL